MKKIAILSIMLIGLNSFSGQILNNKWSSQFKSREVSSLIFGKYDTETELVAISVVKNGNQESLDKAEKDAQSTIKKAIKEYSNEMLNNYLNGALVSGPGFDSSKMKVFAEEISNELYEKAEKRGMWSTSKKETVMMYTISKQTVKDKVKDIFSKRLDEVIKKLSEYQKKFNEM